LSNRNGTEPVKTAASKPLGMAVNVSGRRGVVPPEVPLWVQRVLACHESAQDKDNWRARIEGETS